MSSGADHGAPEAPSLAALKAAFADAPRPDTRPLSEAEKTALRDRLNSARPGQTVKLTHREHTARTEMGIIRTREDVVSLYELVQGEYRQPQASPVSAEFGAGILAAIEWATGVEAIGPITGEAAEQFPPSGAQLYHEQVAALDVAERRRQHARGQNFAVGVEHTLMWLTARTTERPWG
ncbi:hypothetical protein [Actinomadura montaniterrae]|uniref:Uncharacterized protein n=1 Tax=Actinomadura montaniterrae TaxID=1803903 RepID=A0A6L3VXB5_9ACTN|nr:hypothetical protein [Actinomadura montaniterrae]KAB2376966.1 hypothetical protein F9B16_24330 [Actinomadura montaniterrae]